MHTVFDDDAQGYLGHHAQTNDVWLYRVTSEMIAQMAGTSRSPGKGSDKSSDGSNNRTNRAAAAAGPGEGLLRGGASAGKGGLYDDRSRLVSEPYGGAGGWTLISQGGCHNGDDGRSVKIDQLSCTG